MDAAPVRTIQILHGWAQIRQIVRLALPAIMGMLSQTVMNLTDMYMVGRLGREAVAAVVLCNVLVFSLVALLAGLGVGTQALVARRLGQNQPNECGKVSDNAFIVSMSVGLGLALVCVLLSGPIISFFTPDALVRELGLPYLRIRYAAMPFLVQIFTFRGFFNGLGDTQIGMWVAWVANFFNIAANYVLIFGNLGFPELGVFGAGLGTALSQLLAAVLFVGNSFRPYYRVQFNLWRVSNIDTEIIRPLVRLSLFPGLEGAIIIGSFTVFQKFMGLVSTAHVAATGITISIFSLIFLPSVGIGQAAGALVGHHLGANERFAAVNAAKNAVRFCGILTTFIGILFAWQGHSIMAFFNDDWLVQEIGRGTVAIIGIVAALDGTTIVLAHILQSAGLTGFVMAAHTLTNIMFFIPLAFVFGVLLQIGAPGGFAAFGLYIVIYWIVLMLKFHQGTWQDTAL